MSFDEVLGQDRAKEFLRAALIQKRLGQAYLFAGPDGVGKTLLAQEFAKALLCRGSTARPCDACHDCRLVAHDGHPDFFLIEPEGASRAIKIEQVRDLIHTLSLMPVQSERRIAVLREADSLQEAAANALLKTLEEPPAFALLILTASRVRALLPTIRSRCQEIRLAPLSPGQIQTILRSRFELPKEDAEVVARLANGSAERAVELVEFGCLEILGATLERILALPGSDLFGIADDILEWVKAASKSFEPQRERVRRFLYLLESAYRDIQLLQVSGDRRDLLHAARASLLEQSAQRLSPRRLSGIQEAVWDARRQTDMNASMELMLPNLLIRISNLQRAA